MPPSMIMNMLRVPVYHVPPLFSHNQPTNIFQLTPQPHIRPPHPFQPTSPPSSQPTTLPQPIIPAPSLQPPQPSPSLQPHQPTPSLQPPQPTPSLQPSQPEPSLPSEPSTVQCLEIQFVDVCFAENGKNHHTAKFDLMKRKEYPQLVIRRGQEFRLKLHVDRQFDPEQDGMALVFLLAGLSGLWSSVIHSLSNLEYTY